MGANMSMGHILAGDGGGQSMPGKVKDNVVAGVLGVDFVDETTDSEGQVEADGACQNTRDSIGFQHKPVCLPHHPSIHPQESRKQW